MTKPISCDERAAQRLHLVGQARAVLAVDEGEEAIAELEPDLVDLQRAVIGSSFGVALSASAFSASSAAILAFSFFSLTL